MSKTLLVGPAGCGKTHRVLSEFEAEFRKSADPFAKDFYFLLPSAEHTERVTSVLMQRGVPGFFNRRITTLSRLIEEVFPSWNEKYMSEATRFFTLREVLAQLRPVYFSEVYGTSGFLNLMLGFIAELKESLIFPPVFRDRMNGMKQTEPEFAAKYEALAAIYETYQAFLDARGLKDRQDALAVYLERKKRGLVKPLRFKKIWLDGFFDFSPAQFAYLRELCGLTDDLCVTLTLEDPALRREFFEPVRDTENMLLEMGFKREIIRPSETTTVPPALIHLEKNLFSSDPGLKKTKPDFSVQIFEAVGMEGEIEMIARSIAAQYRLGGYRFSDFAVLLREIGDYESVIRSVFGRYQIPVEIHERERLSFAPMIQVIVCLLRIFRGGWARAELMQFLKSSYVRTLGEEPNNYEWVSGLEHAAMASGIERGREAWLGEWQPAGNPSSDFDEIKNRRLAVLAALEDRLCRARDFEELKRAMSEAMEHTFRIFDRVDSLEPHVRRDAAGYKRFCALLGEIEIAFGTQAVESLPEGALFEQFADRFFRLVELDLYSLHERNRNKVQVYSVSLARQKEYRVVFIAGLLEKRFPRQVREDPVLSDLERKFFNGPNREAVLKERLPRQMIERYLFYLAVTRAREKLVLSYPHLDLEGKASLVSYYVEEVRNLFDGKLPGRSQDLSRPYPRARDAVNLRELELSLVGCAWNSREEKDVEDGVLAGLANRLLRDEGSRGRLKRAVYQVADEITDPAVALTGAFRAHETSATALERYAACPFRYYAERVLALKNPEENINAMNKGSILHKVLELCFSEWSGRPGYWKDRAKAKEEACRKLAEVMKEYPLVTEKKYQTELADEDLRDTLVQFLDHELARLASSPLRPKYFEYDFCGGKGNPAPFEIQDGAEKISVRGKIDRIDVDPSNRAALVLDYKTASGFKRNELESGIALQLPLYSMVLERQIGLKCAGAEIYSIKHAEKKGFYHKDYLELFPGLSTRRMILEEAGLRAVLGRSAGYILKFCREIALMKIPVKPRNCEDFCPYGPVCRIEKWRLPVIRETVRQEDEKWFAENGEKMETESEIVNLKSEIEKTKTGKEKTKSGKRKSRI